MHRISALFAILFVVTGCHTAHVQEPLTQKLGGSDPGDQLEFWHQLADRPVTCNDEAFHGLLLYLDSKDENADYAARISDLKSRGMLPKDFNKPANDAVTRGDLAIAIAKALQIKGGVIMHLGGSMIPRYATRELVYMEIYPPSAPHQTFSGAEFLGIIGRVEDWQRGNSGAPAMGTQG